MKKIILNESLKEVNLSSIPTNKIYNKLYTNLTIPSMMNTFSMSVAYMQNWFQSKFDTNFFKATNIDESHVMKAYNKAKMIQNLKRLKPSLFISPKLNIEYDRDNVDLNMYGLKQYTRRDSVNRAFFQDKEKNMYLTLGTEETEIAFSFRVRLSSRAQQLDIANYMNKAFRIGTTQGLDCSMDFHIPYSTIILIAQDAGFIIQDSIIQNLAEFIKYMNSHSSYPILYKFRSVNGKHEFFVRVDNLYTHIDTKDRLNLDDGEQEGQLMSNYMIDMQCILHMAAPRAYAYFSIYEHNSIDIETQTDTSVGLYSIKLSANIPDSNSKGWNKYINTVIYEENISSPLVIEFKELFQGGNIGKLIIYNNDLLISPSIFIDIKLFNDGKEIDYIINWNEQTITTKNNVTNFNTDMVIYVDLLYINEQMISLDKLYGQNI